MTAAGAAAVTHYLFFFFLSFSFFLLCKRRAQLDAIVVVLPFVFSADLLIVLRQTIQPQRGKYITPGFLFFFNPLCSFLFLFLFFLSCVTFFADLFFLYHTAPHT